MPKVVSDTPEPEAPVNYSEVEQRLLVQRAGGGKEFMITLPVGCRTTFGPWSPPSSNERYAGNEKALSGTLRVYQGKSKATETVIAVFSGIASFRNMDLDYMEKIATQEVQTMWKSDKDGYVRSETGKEGVQWVKVETPPVLPTTPAEEEEAPF